MDLDLALSQLAASYSPDVADRVRTIVGRLECDTRWSAHAIAGPDPRMVRIVAEALLTTALLDVAIQIETNSGTDAEAAGIIRHVADVLAVDAVNLAGAHAA